MLLVAKLHFFPVRCPLLANPKLILTWRWQNRILPHRLPPQQVGVLVEGRGNGTNRRSCFSIIFLLLLWLFCQWIKLLQTTQLFIVQYKNLKWFGAAIIRNVFEREGVRNVFFAANHPLPSHAPFPPRREPHTRTIHRKWNPSPYPATDMQQLTQLAVRATRVPELPRGGASRSTKHPQFTQ